MLARLAAAETGDDLHARCLILAYAAESIIFAP